jgi:hypothetical protein
MQKRLTFEIKIDYVSMRVSIGTTNRNTPSAIYIEGKCFIEPTFQAEDYKVKVNSLSYLFKKYITTYLNESENFKNKYIFDLQIPYNCMSKGKKTYMFMQIILRQEANPPLKLNELLDKEKTEIIRMFDKFTNTMVEKGFLVTLKKKS